MDMDLGTAGALLCKRARLTVTWMDEESSPTDVSGVGGDGVDTDGSFFLLGETRTGALAMLLTDETGLELRAG